MPASYTILGRIAKGGMASVYLGRMTGSAGFSRIVAIKRLHPELASDNEFVAMLVDEARLAGRVRHVNVIDTLDLFTQDGAFSLVLEYVEGDALSALVKRARMAGDPTMPTPLAVSIVLGTLRGLRAAHEARAEDGTPLGLVHRDVSPQNILLGVDGVPRVIDFGIAKASGRMMSTKPGEVRGKFSYMAPEQLLGKAVSRQADVYAIGVVLWELLTGARLFTADDAREVAAAVLRGEIPPPSTLRTSLPPEFDTIVARATARELGDRYLDVSDMIADLETLERASDTEVGAWVRRHAADRLAERQRLIDTAPSAEQSSLADIMSDLARSASEPDLLRASSPSVPDAPGGGTAADAQGEVSSTTLPLPFSGPVRPAPAPSVLRSPALLAGVAAFVALGLIGTVVGARRRGSDARTAGDSEGSAMLRPPAPGFPPPLPLRAPAASAASAGETTQASPAPRGVTPPPAATETATTVAVPPAETTALPAPTATAHVATKRPPPPRPQRPPSPSPTIDPRAYP